MAGHRLELDEDAGEELSGADGSEPIVPWSQTPHANRALGRVKGQWQVWERVEDCRKARSMRRG
jgi:hypothetical protein